MNKQTVIFLAIVLVSLGVVILRAHTLSEQFGLRYPRPRFELVLSEPHAHIGYNFDVWHDKETGQEMVCVFCYSTSINPSCYPTGRKW